MPAAARQGDKVQGTDTHVVLVPTPSGPVATPNPHPFDGELTDGLSSDVVINNLPAATEGSVARNAPQHVPNPQSGTFQTPPSNQGPVQGGSDTVLINGKRAARNGDPVASCTDVPGPPSSKITSGSTKPQVVIG